MKRTQPFSLFLVEPYTKQDKGKKSTAWLTDYAQSLFPKANIFLKSASLRYKRSAKDFFATVNKSLKNCVGSIAI